MGNGTSICNTVGLKRQLTILCLGLDNAGKTSITRALVGETFDNITPTIGFSKFVTKLGGMTVNIYDLGGGNSIRAIWNNYYAETHGVVYVLDANDPQRIKEAQLVLSSLMTHPMLRGKPLLLLANKQDYSEAMDEIDVSETLHLEALANECQSPTRIEICCATQGTGKKVDPSIRIGFQWLVSSILHQFDTIQRRIAEDVAEQNVKESKEKEDRKQRIRKANEQISDRQMASNGNEISHKETLYQPVPQMTESWHLPGTVEPEMEETGPSSIHKDSCHMKANKQRNENCLPHQPSANIPERNAAFSDERLHLESTERVTAFPPLPKEATQKNSEQNSIKFSSTDWFFRSNRTFPAQESSAHEHLTSALPPLTQQHFY